MFKPVTLASQKIQLEPLTIAHLETFQLAAILNKYGNICQ